MTAARRWQFRLAALTASFVVVIAFTAAFAIPTIVAPLPGEASTPEFTRRGQQHDRLYFGREKGGGGEVSEDDWAAFLIDVAAPRLNGGFTVLQGVGAWRDAGGTTRYERSFVVEIVHAAGTERDDALRAVIAEYKRRFDQQSVLWLRSKVAVTLH